MRLDFEKNQDIIPATQAVAECDRLRICWGEDSECDLMIKFMRREAAGAPNSCRLFIFAPGVR